MHRAFLALIAGCGFSVEGHSVRDAGPLDALVDAGLPRCDVPATWADGLSPVRTIHVSADATEPYEGTASQPFRTIAQAAAAASPGTRILLAAGSYGPEQLEDVHGSAIAPIWIEGPTGAARAMFSGNAGLHLVRPQYVVLQHLDFTGISAFALNLDDGGETSAMVAHHVVIRDVRAHSVGRGFQLSGVYDVAILDSSVSVVERGVQLVGVHRAMIARIRVEGASAVAVQAAGGSADIELRQSEITGSAARAIWIGGSSDAGEFRPPLALMGNAEARDVRVVNNLIDDGTHAISCSLCTESLVAANRITGERYTHIFRFSTDHGPLGGRQFVPAGAMRVINNAIEVTGNPFGFRMESGTTCSACEIANNLWLRIDDPSDSTPVFPVPETGGIYGVPSGYTAGGDLCADGAAVGVGMPLDETDGTWRGECRPTPPSIGPNEPDGSC